MINHFIIIGDAHRDVPKQLRRVHHAFPQYPPDETAVILLGDVGLNIFRNNSDNRAKQHSSSLGYILYCLRGNHELRVSQVPGMERAWDENVNGFIWLEPEFPLIRYFDDVAGQYNISNFSILTIGGAYSIDKDIRLQMGYFWNPKEELTSEEKEATLNLVKDKHYNFILSHTCPYEFMPEHLLLPQVKSNNAMEHFLSDLSNACIWDNWLFAHFHADEIVKPHVQLLYEKPLELTAIFDYWKNYKPFTKGDNND